MRLVWTMAICVFLVTTSRASEEQGLHMAAFEISAISPEGWGEIKLSGRKDAVGNFSMLTLETFDRSFPLPREILEEISGSFSNGVALSCEAGYPETGGRTVYVNFLVGFTGADRSVRTVAISEDGNIRLLPADQELRP